MKTDRMMDVFLAVTVVGAWFAVMTPLVLSGTLEGVEGKVAILAALVAFIWVALRIVRAAVKEKAPAP